MTRLLRLIAIGVALVGAALLFALNPATAAPPAGDPVFVALTEARAAMLTDPALVIARAGAARAMALTRRDPDAATEIATADWLMGEAYLRLNDFGRARTMIDAAVRQIGPAGAPTKLHGDILMSRGGYNSATGAVANALRDYQRAHDIFRRIGDDRSRAIALINIAVLYGETSDYLNALRYYEQARDAHPGDGNLTFSILSNMAQLYKDMGRYDEAAAQTRAALALARQFDSPALVTHVLRNLARIDLLAGRLLQADRAIAEAFAVADKLPHDDDYAALLATAAQAAMQHGRVAQASDLISRSFAGIDPTRTTLPFRERHQTAYDVYSRAGDTPRALAHLAALKRLDDEATALAVSASNALMGARFGYANQEARIARLRADEAQRNLAFEQARAATQRTIFYGAGGAALVVVALLAGALITIRRSRNDVRRANVVLGRTNGALEEALAAKTAFLATTSHEIRTPLNGILGMTEVILADGCVDASTRDRVGLVHSAGQTMRALVDDILDIAKIESGNLSVDAEPVEVCAVLGDVARLFAEQARTKGLGFEADLTDCPSLVIGDAARLRQIAFNLLSNALKFTAEGTVTLRTATVGGPTPRYRVMVTDSGIGIAPDKLEMIFESFRQADTSTTRRYGGTGLGLSICRNLARAMGGDVSVTSVAGEGSCFTLDLPLAVAERPNGHARRIGLLIVERNPIARSTLRALMEPHLPDVAVAGSLDDALAVADDGATCCMLVDDATLRSAGALAEGVARLASTGTQVVLLWRPAEGESVGMLLDAGAHRVIERPVPQGALLAALPANLFYPGGHLVSQAA